MFYWSKGPHAMKNDTLGKPHDEILLICKVIDVGKAGTGELGLNVEM
jgi:hypothetical protein